MRGLRRQRSARAGFTLIELIISMTIVLLAMGLAGAGFIAQNTALQTSDLHRVANSTSRDAMMVVEKTLRHGGWGVDPRLAIDLTSTFASVDRTNAPDQLTILSRNPMYQWQPVCAAGPGGCFTGNAWALDSSSNLGAGQLRVTLAAGQVFELGRLVQVQCLGGLEPVILTVTARQATAGLQTVTFNTVSAFPYNDTGSLRPCHSEAGAAVFLIDRTRFFVQNYTVGAVTTPWLMMDPTIDADNNAALSSAGDLIPIAANIEDFQVAYVLPVGGTAPDLPLGSGDFILGNASGIAELPVPPALATSTPLYTTLPGHSSRRTTASANVRGVRVSIITRARREDASRPGWPGDAVAYGENRTGTTPVGVGNRFLRFPMVTQITLRNMESQRPFTF